MLSNPAPTGIDAILAAQRRGAQDVAARLSDLDRRRLLGRPLPDLCDSYVHLHCNRLLGPDRTTEHIVLELLFRTRQSLAATAR
ncbi:lantibiotic dehydratase C-terminal domain-containing protein [Kitasatospora sp. NPDC053057]|uniref:lantibiotic dehydratase C-terminal domain-containing protein n=1 Tax=Kitasatospora sp. NPDC053057 TaxID=3364062 RepID=UPI0037C961F2